MGVKLGLFSRLAVWGSGSFFLLIELMLLVEDFLAALLMAPFLFFVWAFVFRACVFVNETGDIYACTTKPEDLTENGASRRDDERFLRGSHPSRILPTTRARGCKETPLRMSTSSQSESERDLNNDIADFLRSTAF